MDDDDDGTEAARQARRDEPQRLFDQGRIFDAAKLGHPAAMGEMACRYFFGTYGTEKDVAKAFDFATKAAKEGDGVGVVVLGKCCEYGR